MASAEARVHNSPLESVHFHEVGRMTNILSVGLIAEIFTSVNPVAFIASPLPLADGMVRCAHGAVPNPAPATLAQLEGVAVRPYNGTGETVTPTGVAILKGLGAQFAPGRRCLLNVRSLPLLPAKPLKVPMVWCSR